MHSTLQWAEFVKKYFNFKLCATYDTENVHTTLADICAESGV